jgi:hypothetical protein
MSATPIIGRNAVVTMGGTAIGYATGVTSNLSADLIKEYAMGSDKAAVLSSGNKSFKISCDKLYVDNTYLSQVLGGTAVDFIIAPAGTTTGKPKITIKNVVLNVWDFKAEQKGVVSEKVSGEGNDLQVGTY